MLSHLAASEGQSQQAISIALGIHCSAVVALVDDLEHRGLAERRRDPLDRRAYALYLTPRGREVLADLERIADEHEAELLTALDASQRSRLISLLQRVAESQHRAPLVIVENLQAAEEDLPSIRWLDRESGLSEARLLSEYEACRVSTSRAQTPGC